MPLQIGSHDGLTSKWQKVIRAWYPKIALAADGGPLKIDNYFGNDDAAVQRAYQAALGVPQTGVVSDHDLIGLGVMPVLFTVQGTGVDMWTGPPADTARALLDVVHWQPIGNYPAATFPMWPSITDGWNELRVQIRKFRQAFPKLRIILCGYSQGAVVVAMCMITDFMASNGEFHDLYVNGQVKLGVTWGNPAREQGKANGNVVAGWPVPTGQGILKHRMVGTPGYWYDFAHGANSSFGRDLYTDTEVGDDTGADETVICDFIMSETWYDGFLNLVPRIAEFLSKPVDAVVGAVNAILQAGMFFGGGTGPHVDYDIQPAIDLTRRVVTAV